MCNYIYMCVRVNGLEAKIKTVALGSEMERRETKSEKTELERAWSRRRDDGRWVTSGSGVAGRSSGQRRQPGATVIVMPR